MKKTTLILFSLILTINISYSQTLGELVKAANNEFDLGNYYAAANLFEQSLNRNPNKIKLRYQLAEALRYSKDYKKASAQYRKTFDKEELFPLARFWYAETLKYQAEYKKAKTAYKRFYKNNRTNKDLKFYILKAKHETNICEKLSIENIEINDINIKLLDTLINSEYGEFSPFEIDSNQLIFSSYRTNDDSIFHSQIFESQTDNDKLAAEIIDSSFYDSDYLYSISPGLDKKHVLITKSPVRYENGNCIIYSAEFSNKKFKNIEKLKGDINLPNYNSRHPFLTEYNGVRYLLFSSDRPGGYGKHDIWYSKLNSNNVFENSKNAGENINSIDDEITPFYFPNDTLLFFSSNWHNGYGGFDVFQSYSDFQVWDSPYNLGQPTNSSYDDLYFSFNIISRNAYFVSNRPGGIAFENETCCNDIYTYVLPWSENDSIREIQRIELRKQRIEQKVTSLKLLTPLQLYFDNDQPNPKSKDTTTIESFEILTKNYLLQQNKYALQFSKGLKRKDKQKAKDEIISFFIDNVETNWNKTKQFCIITEELLNQNKTIILTLKAYTSPLNNPDYNKKLSQRRLVSFLNFLSNYNNGSFIKYIENGKLKINKIAFGESQSSGNVSDNIFDKRNSIYSPRAARSRKITIEAIEIK